VFIFVLAAAAAAIGRGAIAASDAASVPRTSCARVGKLHLGYDSSTIIG
jgi:hypothetical protein